MTTEQVWDLVHDMSPAQLHATVALMEQDHPEISESHSMKFMKAFDHYVKEAEADGLLNTFETFEAQTSLEEILELEVP